MQKWCYSIISRKFNFSYVADVYFSNNRFIIASESNYTKRSREELNLTYEEQRSNQTHIEQFANGITGVNPWKLPIFVGEFGA